ncbi:MAG TPA: phosphate ABC transporter substrate-binding protein PstS [Caulobacteraceae bacterium]|nr:phosphate ABC transporter substrate-binding protein PstS [Caulobacteraceae bacterium]
MLKKFAAGIAGVAIAAAVGAVAIAANISGAGATFPAPIYQKWAEAYKAGTGNQLNYQAIGSGGGIKQIEASTVDFGASDKPLKPEDLDANGLQQFPTVIGGVVPVINLAGVGPGQMKITGGILSDIYRGVIPYWDDPHIKALNPALKLPHEKITVVHRSDGSGTTFIYTTYLSLMGPAWASQVGASDSVNWPAGIGGKGNDGVAALVRQTNGAIGYVEYAYAKQNHMSYCLMQNKAGHWVAPTAENFAAAAAGAKWSAAPGFYLLLVNQPGANAWPISGATFILMHRKQTNAQAAHDVLAFFDWAYKNGNPAAAGLDYVPLPDAVKALIRKSWGTIVGPNGKPVYP